MYISAWSWSRTLHRYWSCCSFLEHSTSTDDGITDARPWPSSWTSTGDVAKTCRWELSQSASPNDCADSHNIWASLWREVCTLLASHFGDTLAPYPQDSTHFLESDHHHIFGIFHWWWQHCDRVLLFTWFRLRNFSAVRMWCCEINGAYFFSSTCGP